MNSDLTATLVAACSPAENIRKAAEEQLLLFEKQNFAQYLSSLCMELANPAKPKEARQLAGIMLKNSISAKDPQLQLQLTNRWLMMADEHRARIRQTVLSILASPSKPARDTACSVIASIAAVEIPKGHWKDLISVLIGNIDKAPNDDLRESTFKALGFVCEEVPERLEEHSNAILEAISRGMKQDQKNEVVKLAATDALYHCLDFAEKNFSNEGHRQTILTMIYSAAICASVKVRLSAFQCLVQIVELYYEYLPNHIVEIFQLTHNAIRNDEADVKLRAIEFWSTVAETEADIMEEIKDCQELGKTPKRELHHFVNKALQLLAPLLLECLTKQAENPADDTWNEAKSAGACLALISTCVKDNVVNHVLPFVQENINAKNWRAKEAAILAFGSILDGPTKEKLQPLVTQAFPVILDHVNDSVEQVKDTSAWTIGRICDLLPQAIDDRILPKLMNTLVAGLKSEPAVASKICWSIHNLANAASPTNGNSSPLSVYFDGLVTSLLECASRADVDEDNLLTSAYESLNMLILSAANDSLDSVDKLITTFVERLQKSAQPPTNEAQRQHQLTLQGLLISSLTVAIQKLSPEKIAPKCQNLMHLFLGILQTPNVIIHEEVLMAISSVAQKIGPDFERFFPPFKPFILNALNESNQPEISQVAVGVIGDVCRALKTKIEPHCDDIVRVLLANLQKRELERTVKPHVISCLGDVALAVGVNFKRYLPYVMMMFVQASQVTFEDADYDTIDYLNQLRESVLEAYTAIVQGLHEGNKSQDFDQYVGAVIALLDYVVKDENRDSGVVNAACGIVGDILSCCGKRVKDEFRVPCIQELMRIARTSRDKRVMKSVAWALQGLQQLA